MAYRLKLKKPLEACVRRILVDECDRVMELLSPKASAATDSVAAIHGTRKALKRMRVLLRLVREGLGKDRWRQENVALRDIARRLSALRDNDVNRQTIARLAIDATGPLALSLGRLGKVITAVGPASADRSDVLASVHAEISVCRDRFERLDLDGNAGDILAMGLAATHRRGRAALQRLDDFTDDEAIHELRKAVQAHWRQMSLMMPVWPELIKARVGEARGLSQRLGEINDLALLTTLVRAAEGQGLSATDAKRITSACKARQSKLTTDAIARSRRLFASKPKSFAAELIVCLHAAEVVAKQQSRNGKGKEG